MTNLKIARRCGPWLTAAVLLLGFSSEGCGGGGGQTVVNVVVDGHNLSVADQMRVRTVWLYVTGDGDGGVVSQMYSTVGLPGGRYTAVYRPHIKSGILDIMVTINDITGTVIDFRQTKATVHSGNQVMATVVFGASVDAGDDVGTIPPMGNGGAAGGGGGAGGGVGGAGVGGSGAGGDSQTPDGSVPDAPGSDAPATCATMACSGATADACCPAACTPLTDMDCAGCGNGQIDPGETCDPITSCKTACPQMGCQLFTLTGANTCQAACVAAAMQTMCVNGDGCCPTGCTTANDTDCSASCGNGVVEGQEICDGSCPSKCPPMGCQLRTLQGSAATCNAVCVNGAMQTACADDDGCCPTGCDSANDSDCAVTCGNGKINPGETCDGNCPTSCPAMGCTLRQLAGSASTCNVSCVTLTNPQMQCLNGDACCPAACNATNDNNCMPKCGNSVLEMGETCDPASACMTVATACVNDANTVVAMTGAPAQCTFVCTRTARTCGPVDTYCPTNVTCGPTMDSDCAGCGNGRIETARGETCDPPSMCTTQMSACTSDKDNVRVSSGSTAACTYRCTTTARTCGPADGFCPTGCGPTMDIDCAGCGNGRVEAALGETCDVSPASPTCAAINCADTDPCTTDAKVVDAANACKVTCTHTPKTTCSLAAGDMCCPSNCNATNDTDCQAVCGNGVIEGSETCNPSTMCAAITCPTPPACSTAVRNGSNAMCNVSCTTAAITACSGVSTADGCCPGGGFGTCNRNNDVDCAPKCGNGALETGETCETITVPAAQLCSNFNCNDGNACTTDVVTGSTATCNPVCTHGSITACSGQTSDGCCPSACNGNTDVDCGASCGNGVVEPGEKCDTKIAGSCPTSCPPVNCVARQLVGSACTAECVSTGAPPACSQTSDGCCSAGCTDLTDADCLPANDKCDNAIDISRGGDFPFNLTRATKEMSSQCSANGTVEVFYTFKLEFPSLVYLDVYESGRDAHAAIELYQVTAGVPVCQGLKIVDCNSGAEAMKTCATNGPWPRVFVAGKSGLPAGTYMVAVRAVGTPNGNQTLRYQRVPVDCALGGPLGAQQSGTTCQMVNRVTPTCFEAASGFDVTYYLSKCPDVPLSLSTCGDQTGKTDTIVQLNSGSVELLNQTSCVPASTGTQVACNDKDDTCTPYPGASIIRSAAKAERGIITITVDTPAGSGRISGCGPYVLNAAMQ